jgi:Tfp pilus assembly protein PilO
MKPIYYFLLLMALFFTGYFIINDFNFDNISFSNYLINTLFFLLLSCAIVAITGYLLAIRRKHLNKDVMTIRQYYQYKSAR